MQWGCSVVAACAGMCDWLYKVLGGKERVRRREGYDLSGLPATTDWGCLWKKQVLTASLWS